jgi:hypothetical protein
MVNDIEGILVGSILFSLYLFVPGYVTGWVTNIFNFRKSVFSERVLVAVCLSVCVSPILANLIARRLSTRTSAAVFLAFSAAFVILVVFEWGRRRRIFPLPMYTRIGFCLVGIISAILLFSLIDIQIGSRLYPPAEIFDHIVRVAFIGSAARSGAPPANPFFFPGRPIPSRYYYYWNVLAALPVALGGMSPRSSLYASCIWSALALASAIPLYLKYFFKDTDALPRKSLIGIGLLSVTGLDLIPTFLLYLWHHFLFTDMEWWDSSQVTSWADALLWVPHHVASLVACLIGFLALWSAKEANTRYARWSHTGLAALGFSSAAGLSVYVTLAFIPFLAVWTIRYLAKREWRAFGTFAFAGLLTVLLSLPYLHDLRQPARTLATESTRVPPSVSQTGAGQQASLLKLEPRTEGFTSMILGNHPWTTPIELLEVAGLYFFEFGFYGLAAWIVFRSDLSRHRELSEAQRAAWYLVVVVGFLTTFVRSSVIQANDFGFRGIMLVQFVFLLWGAQVIDELWFRRAEPRFAFSRSSSTVVLGTLVLGLLGTLYQLALLRTEIPLTERGYAALRVYGEPKAPHIGQDTYEFRAGFASLENLLLSDSTVQSNPFAGDANSFLIYNRYQLIGAFLPGCGTEFGGSPAECAAVGQKLARIFPPDGNAAATGAEVDEICDELKIQFLIAHVSDPLWGRRTSWVWERIPLMANDAMRTFRCGASQVVTK